MPDARFGNAVSTRSPLLFGTLDNIPNRLPLVLVFMFDARFSMRALGRR